MLFYEYFHGDNGAGLGASHQTGWTGPGRAHCSPASSAGAARAAGQRGAGRRAGTMQRSAGGPSIYEIDTAVWLGDLGRAAGTAGHPRRRARRRVGRGSPRCASTRCG